MIRDLILKNRSYRRFYQEVDIKLETVGPSGDTKYWRDSKGVHHVPKRLLDDIIIG